MTAYVPVWRTKLVREENMPIPPGATSYVSSPADLYALMKPLVEDEVQENLWVLLLNTKKRVVGIEKVYRGCVHMCNVRVAEVLRPAILANATSIVVVHNHPSGDPTPSGDDVRITRHIVQAGNLLDIAVLDHIVASDEGFASIKERRPDCWAAGS